MSTHRTLNMAAFVVVMVCMWMFVNALFDDEQEAKDKRHFASLTAEAKFAMAAHKACGGENSVYEALPDGRFQCRNKRGSKTIIAGVAP